jgi:hypothetical protein
MFPHKGIGVTVHVKFAFVPVNGNGFPVYFLHRKDRIYAYKTEDRTYKGAFFHGYLQNYVLPLTTVAQQKQKIEPPNLRGVSPGSARPILKQKGRKREFPASPLVRGDDLLFVLLGAEAYRQIAVFPVVGHTVTALCVVRAIDVGTGTLFHIGTRHNLSPLHPVDFTGISKQPSQKYTLFYGD